MMKKRFGFFVAIIFTALVALLLSGCGDNGVGSEEAEFEPLTFPFSTPSHVVRLAAFGIPNWSGEEPHNGIDLIANETLESTTLISPTDGTISAINISENPFSNPINQLLLQVEISINSEWTVVLVIEPSTVDEQLKTNQINAVQVEVGQSVVTGDEIADLLIGDLGYPHLHYMLERHGELVCAYKHSSGSAKALFEGIPKSFESEGFICHGDVSSPGKSFTFSEGAKAAPLRTVVNTKRWVFDFALCWVVSVEFREEFKRQCGLQTGVW